MRPTADDYEHLVSAMKDVSEGWCLHPFTCSRFRLLGWLDSNGWTHAAYDAKRSGGPTEGQT